LSTDLQPSGITLLVLAKEPIPGRVKTRLAPAVGAAGAARLAEAALADTLQAVAEAALEGGNRTVLALDGSPGDWVPPGFQVVPQRGSGLAERLTAAFADAAGAALLVGMDTPQIKAATLTSACGQLCEPGTDAVIGLAEDGGWWTLGMRAPHPLAFRGVPMSEASTGAAQLEALASLGLATRRLAPLRDVDTIDDAVAVAAESSDSRFAAALAELLTASPSVER
jgi:rSAM/selenodomain-associated transferase 1